MEEQRLDNYLNLAEYDLNMYEDETTITYISFPIYQVHKVDPIFFTLILVHLIPASDTRLSKELSVILDVDLFQ